MSIDAYFTKHNTFTANVEITIPGKKADVRTRMKAEFRYLDQKQVDALINGEPLEIDGKDVDAEADDATILDHVLVGWKDFKLGDDEMEYSEENREAAMRHGPIRVPLITAFFTRLSGGERGGKRVRRKN